MDHKPYLSIVAASRNDNHGGRLLERMQIFVNAFLSQCQKYQLSAELIIVEWNPPLDKPQLDEVLDFSMANNYCPIRLIKIPKKIHEKLQYSEQLPLFQMIAKNVGIRRAQSPFILATNIDLLFSDALIKFIASKSLKTHYLYRTDRYDVESNIPLEATVEQQIKYCENHILRINGRKGTKNLKTGDYKLSYSFLHDISIPKWLQSLSWMLHEKLDKKKRISKRLAHYLWMYTQYPDLYTNACGDFTLMAREDWFNLRGYPELEIFSWHLDSLLCFSAYYQGLQEVILPSTMRTYHIEHGGGWTPEIEKKGILDNHLKTTGVPKMTDQELEDYIIQMHRIQKPIEFNCPDWGFAQYDLQEIVFPAGID